MIETALRFVVDELNRALSDGQEGLTRAVLDRIVDADGTIPITNRDRVVVSLLHVSQVRDGMSAAPVAAGGSGSDVVKMTRPINLNLSVIVSATFQDYPTGLKMLSRAIGFLQANRVFRFGDAEQKIVFDMEEVDFPRLSHLWGAIGTKILPSATYKARMISIPSDWVVGVVPRVTSIGPAAEPTDRP